MASIQVANTHFDGSIRLGGYSPNTNVNVEDDVGSDLEIGVPKNYRVFIHNDDYTSMEFVMEILMTIFKKGFDEARKLMLETHHKGMSMVGVYSREIAETKIHQVETLAEQNEFPLQLSMNPE